MSDFSCQQCGEHIMDCFCKLTVEQMEDYIGTVLLNSLNQICGIQKKDESEKWIKCTEKLPEFEMFCWIYDRIGKEVEMGHFYGSRGFLMDEEYMSFRSLQEISHWMPFYTPEPPKEVKNELDKI